jgi:hypothetical protein
LEYLGRISAASLLTVPQRRVMLQILDETKEEEAKAQREALQRRR